ncbi:MAG: hypothetical protein RLZZ618_1690 [Pseudomonadota bacterium]|jgi:carbonic anhydrase
MRFQARPWVAALLPLVLALPWASHALDAPAIRTSPGKPAQLTERPDATKEVKSVPPREVKAAPAADPLDRVRQRLAEKLGAAPAASTDPSVVHVVARSSASPAAGATRAMVPSGTGHGGVSDNGTITLRPRGGQGPVRAVPHRAPVVAWSYEGAGAPDRWGQLRPEYARCSTGKRQSPIDIRDGIAVQLDPVQFDYKPSGFGVIDTGRTVQVNVEKGNFIHVAGRRYDLVRFDFQRPSEERINGRQFDMGVHLVHKDAEGRTAVVAVLLERGAEQPVVQSVWNNLPLEKGEEFAAQTGVDLTTLLPSDRRYFTYMGSMTTPPCQEGVLWMVMKQPISVSSEQLAVFSRLYPMNARPIQAASGRLIKGPN